MRRRRHRKRLDLLMLFVLSHYALENAASARRPQTTGGPKASAQGRGHQNRGDRLHCACLEAPVRPSVLSEDALPVLRERSGDAGLVPAAASTESAAAGDAAQRVDGQPHTRAQGEPARCIIDDRKSRSLLHCLYGLHGLHSFPLLFPHLLYVIRAPHTPPISI